MHDEQREMFDLEIDRSRAELALLASIYARRGDFTKAREIARLLHEMGDDGEHRDRDNPPGQLEA